MRSLVGIALAGFVGSAAAGGDAFADARYADGNDYSAKVFYSLDFGSQGHAQSVGLRFDNERASERGAPALFQASFDGQAAPSVKLQGIDLTGPAMAAGQKEGAGPFAGFTTVQWVGFGLTVVLFGVVAADVTSGDDVAGTGAN